MVIVLSDLAALDQVGSFLLSIVERFFRSYERATLDVSRFAHCSRAKDMAFELDPAEAWKSFEERLLAGRTDSFIQALKTGHEGAPVGAGDAALGAGGRAPDREGAHAARAVRDRRRVFEVVDGDRRLLLLDEGDVIGETCSSRPRDGGRRRRALRPTVASSCCAARTSTG